METERPKIDWGYIDTHPSVAQVDRIARLIWWLKDGEERNWARFLDKWRAQARAALTTKDGWKEA